MITITSGVNHILVEMGDYYPSIVPIKKGYWRKDQVNIVTLNTDHIEIDASDGRDWLISFDGNSKTSALVVDSIDGEKPTSNDDLFDKLIAIL